jgi:predicted nucleic acid-binding protein
MSVRLLDVNVLISILDSAHTDHDLAVNWFRSAGATEGCAIG